MWVSAGNTPAANPDGDRPMQTAAEPYRIEWSDDRQCWDLVDAATAAWVDSDPSLDAVLEMARTYPLMED